MPDLRAIIVALGVGMGLSAYTILLWHWPLALGGGVGIVLGGLTLVGSVSIGAKPTDADTAWREAAPEFIDPPASPLAGRPTVRSGAEGEASDGAEAAPQEIENGLRDTRRPS
ncbi:MAG: hypothetical protein ABI573_05790 [Chloroflexota bacterium]